MQTRRFYFLSSYSPPAQFLPDSLSLFSPSCQLAKCRKIRPGREIVIQLPTPYWQVLLNFLQNFALLRSFSVCVLCKLKAFIYVCVWDSSWEKLPPIHVFQPAPAPARPVFFSHTETNYAQTPFVQQCVYVTHYSALCFCVCLLIRFSCKETDQRVPHTSVDHTDTPTYTRPHRPCHTNNCI